MHAKQLRRVARSTKATKMAKEKKMPQEVGCSAKSKSVAWISKNHQTALVSFAEVKRLSINSRGIVGAVSSWKGKINSWRITGTGWDGLNPPILEAGSLLVAAVTGIPMDSHHRVSRCCPNWWQRHATSQGSRCTRMDAKAPNLHSPPGQHIWRGSDRSTSAFAGIFKIYQDFSAIFVLTHYQYTTVEVFCIQICTESGCE